MNYAFFGTPEFAAIILKRLIDAKFPPELVITNPDKPVGRKKILMPPPVKKIADAYKILVSQPERLTTQNPAESGVWDFFLITAYGKIIPKVILDIPRLGVINIHPSLLPKHRGPTPIQTAILNGDEKTGVSLMLLDEEVDHGPIIAQRELGNHELGIMNYQNLSIKLAELGAKMLVETLPKYFLSKITPKEQEHEKATFTKKITLDDAFVKYKDLAAAVSGTAPEITHRIDRMIRALQPEPGVWTVTNESPTMNLPKNKRVKLLEAEITDSKLKLKKVQVEGKKPRILD